VLCQKTLGLARLDGELSNSGTLAANRHGENHQRTEYKIRNKSVRPSVRLMLRAWSSCCMKHHTAARSQGPPLQSEFTAQANLKQLELCSLALQFSCVK